MPENEFFGGVIGTQCLGKTVRCDVETLEVV
jgi:hypothetical protein